MSSSFRLLDFNVLNQTEEEREKDQEKEKDQEGEFYENDKEEYNPKKDTTQFLIQMFGINKTGKSCSIIVENFSPFFYVLVDETWKKSTKDQFIQHIKSKLGNYYANSIKNCIIVKRKKLYGFDCGKTYKFVKLEFNSILSFNKAKNLWYSEYIQERGRILLEDGYLFLKTKTRLYEANIPPLLRFFHICDISPSGWIMIPEHIMKMASSREKRTHCDYEVNMNLEDIYPMNSKEDRVPYKICSFDIEASSSHGDFPVPIKSYKKLATNIVEYFESLPPAALTQTMCKNILQVIILTAFGYDNMAGIDRVYPKISLKTRGAVLTSFESWIKKPVRNFQKINELLTLENYFQVEDEDDELGLVGGSHVKSYSNKTATVIDIICDSKCDRDSKLNEITISFNSSFPALKGDEITFIGSTFMYYGESKPYLNHCAVQGTCTSALDESTVIESCSTEKEVMLSWTDLIQRENPDIIIGYNIFGFDYNFMFKRAEENDCVEDFLQLSRNKDEICATMDKETGKYKIEESTIQLASGQHDLHYIKMNGRLQIDLYNFFRREENLTSYKLDYVAGHFIGDYVKSFEHDAVEKTTRIITRNLTGLLEQSYIHFEEIGHSVDYYNSGAKYCVTRIDAAECSFEISGIIHPDMTKKVRWCLAKDDVSPKDIFQMTNGSAQDRGIIAKYCIQDCNLVHYLMNKVDVLTGFIEMAKICSVPVNFLVMRGQGIKLTSYIAKKCREKGTLMPVMEKGSMEDGYEGAIVLDPKCDLYLDNPVACVDYASLYPSSMISENLSHDSKVWTKEYDLANNLICEEGEKNAVGEFIYDNLAEYDYVDISYDTYVYIRKTPSAAAKKVKSGRKICRFAQFRDGEKAIMPSILEELLMARKNTRKLIPLENDEFMKNVLDKRQIGYKLTANSLYGQCGAKTSTFYEQDVAAATTATGRLLLTYAKRVIEEVYGDTVCQTANHGLVLSKAEYIYGDTDSVFFTFNLQTLEGVPIRGKQALEITIELAQEAGHLASSFLKAPHDLEYEKTFMPFCLLSKKRYVGMLYETDPNKCKRKEMGIVLKRRDNAPIVKDIYGGIIDILMKKQNIQEAIDFLCGCLTNIVQEKYPMDKLIITKSLRSGYKNPKSVAHKVLADRIATRDPGNKPCSGDRIPFVYINCLDAGALQGEKIETPQFIIENELKIDYSFYITNQIMKPVQQVFALVLEKIWIMQKKTAKLKKFHADVATLRRNALTDEAFEDKVEQLKNREIKALLFDEYLRKTTNAKMGNQSLMNFFGKK